MRRYLLICIQFLALGRAAIAQPIVKGPQAVRIDLLLRNITPFGFSGVIAVEKNGGFILKKAYGLANRTTGAVLTESTPFIIGSLSKQFTASAILKLESQGKLKLTDTLGRFFAEAPAYSRGLTLHQLMTHSAGLPYFSKSSLMEQKPRKEKMQELIQLEPEFTPGSKFSYSNPGYTILAGVIEAASGMSFEQYLRTSFFDPLGMSETGFVAEHDRWKDIGPHSYSDGNDEGALSDWPEGAEFVGAGNIVSTVGDLHKWEAALKASKVLPDSSRAKLFTPHISTQGKNGYGYGWNVNKTIRNTTVIAHAGDLGGYNSDFRRYINEGYTLIFLSNAREGGRGYRDAAMNQASLILTGSSVSIPPSSISMSPEALRDFAGTYSDNTCKLVVAASDHGLTLTALDQQASNLLSPNVSDSVVSKLSATTDRILHDLQLGEFETLREFLSPSFPFDDSKGGFAEMLRSSDLGKLIGVVVTASTVSPQYSGRTYFTLTFERGKRHHSYAWMAGKITGAKDEPSAGFTLRLLPVSATAFVNIDPCSGRTIEVLIGNGRLSVGEHELRKR